MTYPLGDKISRRSLGAASLGLLSTRLLTSLGVPLRRSRRSSIHVSDDDLRQELNARDFGAQGNGRTDDTAALQALLDQADASRPPGADRGAAVVRIPRGEYVVSAPLFAALDRMHIRGDGSALTVIRLRDGVHFTPSSTNEKLGILTARRRGQVHNWSITGLTLRGNWDPGEGIVPHTDDHGLVLYNVQQNGCLVDVATVRTGGHGLYYGRGADPINPESSLFSVRDSWFLESGLSNISTDHDNLVVFDNVHAERSYSGDNFVAQGTFINCHVEFGRYGFNVNTNGDSRVSVLVSCDGYRDATTLPYSQTNPSSGSALVHGTGVICQSVRSSGYRLLAELGSARYVEDSHDSGFASIARQPYQLAAQIRVGDDTVLTGAQPHGAIVATTSSGGIADGILQMWRRVSEDGSRIFQSALYQRGAPIGSLPKALILAPDDAGDGAGLVVTFDGNATHQFSRSGYDLSGDLNAVGGYRQTIDGWQFDSSTVGNDSLLSLFGSGQRSWIAPRSGSITAVLVRTDNPPNTGGITLQVLRNGAAVPAANAQIRSRANAFSTTVIPKDRCPFAAGDVLELQLTYDQSIDPKALSVRAVLEVET